MGSIYSENKWEAKSLSSVAHLIVHISDVNDQRPHFERSLYTVQIELASFDNDAQFVTKLSAKDIDQTGDILTYSIQSQPWPYNLFSIESQSGLVYLDSKKYDLYSKISDDTMFNLIVAVSDSIFSQTARMSVNIKNVHTKPKRPQFKSDLIYLNLGI